MLGFVHSLPERDGHKRMLQPYQQVGTSTQEAAGAFQHPALGRTFTRLVGIAEQGDAQIGDTIGWMTAFVRSEAQTPTLRNELGLVRLLCSRGDALCLVENIWRWVWSTCRFVEDAETAAPLEAIGYRDIVEVLVLPSEMIRVRRGDCDDFSMFVAALLEAAGIPWRFVTVAADPDVPDEFSHVYVMGYPAGVPVALDASHGRFAGWQAQRVFRRKEWSN